MIDIDKKIEKIEKNCIETAKKELNALKTQNDDISEKKILEMLDLYKEELSKKYEAEINKLQREFNRNIFEYEMNEKKKINDYRQSLINLIQNKIIESFENYVQTSEYGESLRNNISIMRAKLFNNECTLYLTENDYTRFSEEFKKQKEIFPDLININIEKIGNEYIGGCIMTDHINKISIDNTIKSRIEEEIDKIQI